MDIGREVNFVECLGMVELVLLVGISVYWDGGSTIHTIYVKSFTYSFDVMFQRNGLHIYIYIFNR